MNTKKGTSILEVVIATAMISMAVISALALTAKSQSQNTYARRSAEANKYASQAADWLRGERDNLGYPTIASVSGTYCLATLPASFSTLPSPGDCGPSDLIGNTYKRTIVLDNATLGKVIATISVAWEEVTTRSTTVSLELTQW
ncbi:MAG: hypothetical protein WAV40_03945 [Microgenomates group bacterium]